jgi:hypothetical protein
MTTSYTNRRHCTIQKIKLNTIASQLFRVLPNVRLQQKHVFEKIRHDKNLLSYFKSFRTLQEYPGLYDIFKKFGFDMSLADKVKIQAATLKESFHENIKQNFLATTSKRNNKYMCSLTQEELDFVVHQSNKLIFPGGIVQAPHASKEEVLESINKKASQGLPNPHVKKRDILQDISLFLDRFFRRELTINDIFTFPSAAFSRTQIKSDKGASARVVNAVHAYQQVIESFYALSFKNST